jgi:hypothetical protein
MSSEKKTDAAETATKIELHFLERWLDQFQRVIDAGCEAAAEAAAETTENAAAETTNETTTENVAEISEAIKSAKERASEIMRKMEGCADQTAYDVLPLADALEKEIIKLYEMVE